VWADPRHNPARIDRGAGMVRGMASVAVRELTRRERRALPLAQFLTVLTLLATGLPMLITMWFWHQFLVVQEDALTRQALTRLEQNLVNLDGHYPTLLRRLDHRYSSWRQRFENAIRQPRRPDEQPVLVSQTSGLRREFPPGTDLRGSSTKRAPGNTRGMSIPLRWSARAASCCATSPRTITASDVSH